MRARINGIDLGFDVRGEGSVPLILLHAFPFNRRMWEAQAETLARQAGVRVILPDVRGCGESDVVSELTTMDEAAQDLRGLLDAQGVGDFVLGGLSMGGYIAFACLRLFGERVRALILADTRATADSDEGRIAREATARFVLELGAAALFDRDAGRLFSAVTLHEHPSVVERGRAIAAENRPEGLAALSLGMALRPDSTDLLPLIRCPTLVIVGEQDALTPVADARMLFERIPFAELEVIADAGHVSNLERPDAFNARVARFLRERVPQVLHLLP